MITETTQKVNPSSTGGEDDELDHLYCCDENVAMCGTDITNATWCQDPELPCAVCDDLDNYPCERCGE